MAHPTTILENTKVMLAQSREGEKIHVRQLTVTMDRYSYYAETHEVGVNRLINTH